MRILPSLIATGMIALSFASTAAADVEIKTDFTYDLTQTASWNYDEIRKTAGDACEPRVDRNSVVAFYSRADEAECQADLVEQAIALFDIDELTRLHTGIPPLRTYAANEIASD